MLLVRNLKEEIVAVYTSYACHCVTLSDNRVSGDWAGYAQEHLERLFPGAVGLVSVGCGADSNPSSGVTGDKAEVAAAQGLEIAEAAQKVVAAAQGRRAGVVFVASRYPGPPEVRLPAVRPERGGHGVERGRGHDAGVGLRRVGNR